MEALRALGLGSWIMSVGSLFLVDEHEFKRLSKETVRDTVRQAAQRAVAQEVEASPSYQVEGADRQPSAPTQKEKLPEGCHVLPHTELHGPVVKWGADHYQPTASACCEACQQFRDEASGESKRCTVWVYCEDEARRMDVWHTHPISTSPNPQHAEVGSRDCEPGSKHTSERFAHLCQQEAPHASTYIAEVLREGRLTGCSFYRAEPVPPQWGSLEAPDTWQGGRWGPPYALLQGTLHPGGSQVKAAKADAGSEARPVIRRGMLAWAGGGGGPDFFIALAEHPEWGHGHTVFGNVVTQDMEIVDEIMRQPLKVENWGSINATVLQKRIQFDIQQYGA
ncbi:hypothetical protein CYMTET_54200 [Cymbomonas tetramitiformis]|uniref:PPIase cyclophilin-type domain-containing protein n=1 Tax=Cymbomonas tetramitiformis TaxID=36881 RepID=A0AAE0EPB0_9CHLO|nr:hypothetical protein CYMTET_54200 [Cymbomonas tetramitiformis]